MNKISKFLPDQWWEKVVLCYFSGWHFVCINSIS